MVKKGERRFDPTEEEISPAERLERSSQAIVDSMDYVERRNGRAMVGGGIGAAVGLVLGFVVASMAGRKKAI